MVFSISPSAPLIRDLIRIRRAAFATLVTLVPVPTFVLDRLEHFFPLRDDRDFIPASQIAPCFSCHHACATVSLSFGAHVHPRCAEVKYMDGVLDTPLTPRYSLMLLAQRVLVAHGRLS
jgi:hypothetical protein